jgi:hypothetical protein
MHSDEYDNVFRFQGKLAKSGRGVGTEIWDVFLQTVKAVGNWPKA